MAEKDVLINLKANTGNFDKAVQSSLAALKKEAENIKKQLRTGTDGKGLILDVNQIDQLKARLSSLNPVIAQGEKELRNLGKTSKMSGYQMLEMAENITVATAGVKALVGGIFNFTSESVKSAANLQVLRANFKGTNDDIELFRQATGKTVGQADLIKLSNQASDLGLTLQQQPLFFLLAKQSAEKYGIGVEEAFQKVVMATEGNIRGLKSVGIQKAVYNQILNDLVKSKGGELQVEQGMNEEQTLSIKNLDAQTQKELRIQAVLEAKGITLNDVNKKQQTNADKLAQLDLLVPQVKKQFGEMVSYGLIPLTDALRNSDGSFNTFTVGATGMGLALGNMLPLLASARIAFPELATAIKNSFSGVGLYVAGELALITAAIMATMYLISEVNKQAANQKKWKEEHPNEEKYLKENYYNKDATQQKSKTELTSIDAEFDAQGNMIKGSVTQGQIIDANLDKARELDDKLKDVNDKIKNIGDYKPDKIPGTGSSRGGSTGSDTSKEIDLINELISKQNQRIELLKLEGQLGLGTLITARESLQTETDKIKIQNDGTETDNKRIDDKIKLLRAIKEVNKEILDITDKTSKIEVKEVSGYVLKDIFGQSQIDKMDLQRKKMEENVNAQVELAARLKEAWGDSILNITSSFGSLMGAMTQTNGDAGQQLKQFLKSVATSFISLAQVALLAATAVSSAKAVSSFGLTLIKDFPLIAAGYVALEIAKGFVGAMYQGGVLQPGQMALVGDDRGRITPQTELIVAGSQTRVYSNKELNNILHNNNTTNNYQAPIVQVKVSGLLRDLVKVGIDQNNKRTMRLAY